MHDSFKKGFEKTAALDKEAFLPPMLMTGMRMGARRMAQSGGKIISRGLQRGGVAARAGRRGLARGGRGLVQGARVATRGAVQGYRSVGTRAGAISPFIRGNWTGRNPLTWRRAKMESALRANAARADKRQMSDTASKFIKNQTADDLAKLNPVPPRPAMPRNIAYTTAGRTTARNINKPGATQILTPHNPNSPTDITQKIKKVKKGKTRIHTEKGQKAGFKPKPGQKNAIEWFKGLQPHQQVMTAVGGGLVADRLLPRNN